jgi:hypothetical protein
MGLIVRPPLTFGEQNAGTSPEEVIGQTMGKEH